MKRFLPILLVIFILCGCSGTPETSPTAETMAKAPAADTMTTVPAEETVATAPVAETVAVAPAAKAQSQISPTEAALLEVFQQHAKADALVLDWVIMEKSACNVAGVVQYTLDGGKTCRFDFVRTDGTLFRMGMEFGIDGENTLQYAGEDRVSCRFVREDGSKYTGTIIYYEDAESGEKGFKVSEAE